MKFAVALRGTVTSSFDGELVPAADEHIESHLDDVMDELMALEAEDPTIDLDLSDGNVVRFSVVADATNPIEAIEKASALIRSAIHAASGGTPDWPHPHDEAWGVRLIGVDAEELVPEAA